MTKDEFAKLVEGEGFFIETAEFSGNFYGTSFSAVQGGCLCISLSLAFCSLLYSFDTGM